jgi:hypothetical protein
MKLTWLPYLNIEFGQDCCYARNLLVNRIKNRIDGYHRSPPPPQTKISTRISAFHRGSSSAHWGGGRALPCPPWLRHCCHTWAWQMYLKSIPWMGHLIIFCHFDLYEQLLVQMKTLDTIYYALFADLTMRGLFK